MIYDLSVGGAQTVVINYLMQMSNDSNYDVRLLVRDSNMGSANDIMVSKYDLPVTYCEYHPFVKIPVIRTVLNIIKCNYVFYKELRKNKPDIVHTHLTDILPYTIFAVKLAGIKVHVHTLHSDPDAVENRFARWARFAFDKLSVYPICVTEAQAEKATKRYRLKKYDVIHNGIDESRFHIDETKEEIRASLGIMHDSFVIGSIGRFSKVKNNEFLINVFYEYHKIHLNAVLLLVGDGDEKKRYVEIIEKYGIDDFVIFTGLRNDVERLYKAMDVFMLTSFFESSSIVTVEAQFSGLKCVISSNVPQSVVISDKVNRLPLDASINDWMQAIDDKMLHDSICGDASSFSMKTTIGKLTNLYNGLLGTEQ